MHDDSEQPGGRRRILEAALEIVEEDGVKAATLISVARKAGVSRQAIYLFYGGRSGLLGAVTRHKDRTSGVGRRFRVALASETPSDCLRRVVEVWFGYLPEIGALALALMSAAQAGDEAAGEAWDDRMRVLQDAFGRAIRRIYDAGLLADGWSVEEAADFTWALAHATTWHHLVRELDWQSSVAAERVSASLEAVLLKR